MQIKTTGIRTGLKTMGQIEASLILKSYVYFFLSAFIAYSAPVIQEDVDGYQRLGMFILQCMMS